MTSLVPCKNFDKLDHEVGLLLDDNIRKQKDLKTKVTN